MRIEQLLSESVQRYARNVAVMCGRASHSYAELDRKSDRLAATFAERGVLPGDRVAVFLDNGFPAVVAAFAALKAGAILCPLDPSSHSDGLVRFLFAARATAIVTEARLASTVAEAINEARDVRLVVLVGADRASVSDTCLSYETAVSRLTGSPPASAGEETDTAVMVRRIGPSGDVAIESVSHGDLFAAAMVSVGGMQGESSVSTSLPLASLHGLYQLIAAVRVGATQILEGPSTGRAPMKSPAQTPEVEALRLALA